MADGSSRNEARDGRQRMPVPPYMAVGLSTVAHDIGERMHIDRQLLIVEAAINAGRFFNALFVIWLEGEVVDRAAKTHLWCRERSCTPHDVYDRWVEVFGDGIDAFYPVLRTDDIGNLGTICCSDGEYPEAVR